MTLAPSSPVVRWLLGLAGLLPLLWGLPATAATFYTSLSGNNGNSCATAQTCTSPTCTTAKGTIAGGIACLSAGDTLYIRQGSYAESIHSGVQAIPSGTSQANLVVIAGFPQETVTLFATQTNHILLNSFSSGSYRFLLFDNLILDGTGAPGGRNQEGISTFGANTNNVIFQNIEVRNMGAQGIHGGTGAHTITYRNLHAHHNGTDTGDHGFYICQPNTLIDGGSMHHNSGAGIQIYDQTPGAAGCANSTIIRGTTTYSNVTAGTTLSYGNNIQYYNNVSYNNGAGGVEVAYGGPTGTQVAHNSLYNNGAAAIQLLPGGGGAPQGTAIRNNILYGNPTPIADYGASGTIQSDNFLTNPQYQNPASGNFALQSTSTAKDTVPCLAAVPTDFLQTARPQGPAGPTPCDPGAYEIVQGGGGPSPSGNPIYLSAGGHGDTPSDGDGSVQSCLNAENIGTPKASLAGVCPCMTVPGKALRIRGGTYGRLETLTCPITGGTSWATATTITAYQNETVTFALPSGQFVGLFFNNPSTDHFIVVNQIRIDALNRPGSNALVIYPGAHHLRFVDSLIGNTVNGFEAVYIQDAQNIEFVSTTPTPTTQITNAGTDGIGVVGTVDGLVLQGVNVHHNGAKGLNLSVGGGSHSNVMINRSDIHHNGAEGVDVGPGNGLVVQNTHLYRNAGVAGLRIRSGANNVRVDNNNAANNANRGLQCDAGATNVRWRNNMMWENGAGQNAILNNCGGTQTTNLLDTLDPRYTNSALDDYRPLPISPALNAGTDLPELTEAYDGGPRVEGIRSDIGPWEQDAPLVPPDPLTQRRVRVHQQSFFQ